MLKVNVCACAALGAAGLFVQSGLADFSGQTILGPLVKFSAVSGTTAGKSDDNDGFSSGGHFFNIWDGGDDVWQLNWTGGDMLVTLDSLGGADNDLFIYRPGSLDDSGDYSIIGAHDEVFLSGAAAGTYYIVVDSTFSSEGAYNLSVTVPGPAAGAVFALGAGVFGIRRRRA